MTALIDHKRGVLLGPGPAAVAPDEVAGEQQHPQQQQDGGGHDNEHHLLLCEGAEDACTAGVGDRRIVVHAIAHSQKVALLCPVL
eukprot:CAMPEP_0173229520 /NCGR_PEP_ID=MMETSP1142-20121109/7190_1 /TAXON_ID=483371 /ORGANISM="non described non described, Strain CCMP2298" /LENGTH=84 /DNA_ID=CAMNT_0014158407 /DNA_START=268 /DNA_END=522 /DNA_ORIENTATION=+